MIDPNTAVQINGTVSTLKLAHGKMILDGVCTHCARCGLALTDAVSVQRGLGPECSSKGYTEDANANADEIQAMIDLAEYPELVEFLTEHYKPLGVRGLVNGLTRIASLNRKSPVHAACCDAIHSLGHHKLASLLRETLAVAEIKVDPEYPDYLHVWVKKSEWSLQWSWDLNKIYGTKPHPKRGTLVLFCNGRAYTEMDGRKVSNRRLLWEALKKHYTGFTIKTKDGAHKIK